MDKEARNTITVALMERSPMFMAAVNHCLNIPQPQRYAIIQPAFSDAIEKRNGQLFIPVKMETNLS